MKASGLFFRLLWLLWPLRFLLRYRIHPEGFSREVLDSWSGGRDIIFVLPRVSLVDVFVLNRVLARVGFAKVRFLAHPDRPRRSTCLFLRPRSRLLFFTSRNDPFTGAVAEIVHRDSRVVQERVVFVPVSVFWGMAPKGTDRSLLLRLFFPDDERANSLQKAWIVLLNCRSVHVHFGTPLPVKMTSEVEDEVNSTGGGLSPRVRLSHEVALQHAQRIRRNFLIEFCRERAAVLGPSLYTFDAVAEAIIGAASTQEMLASGNESPRKTIRSILSYLNEMAANYNYMTVLAYEFVLDFVWTRIFKGIRVRNFHKVASIARAGRIVWMPCHRSHVDYLLLSYVVMKRGLVVPHIAAGINLNFWPLGSTLRRGGAFFLRRSFQGNRLYSYVFRKYVDYLMYNGYPIEFFQEGGRTRIGKLLAPKLGMLNICTTNIVERKSENIYFVPVYFGYEKVLEGESYASELMGARKQKESMFQFVAALRKLFSNFGRVDVSFGTPLHFGECWKEFFEKECPREIALPSSLLAVNENVDFRDPGLQAFVGFLARRVNQGVNAAASVSGSGALAAVFLTEAGSSIEDAVLSERLRVIHWIVGILRRTLHWDIAVTGESSEGGADYNLEAPQEKDAPRSEASGTTGSVVPVSPPSSVTVDKFIRETVEDAKRWQFITEETRNGRPVWKLNPAMEMQLWWYRGNIFHILALPGIVTSVLLDLDSESRTKANVAELFAQIREVWQEELFWPDVTSTDQLVDAGFMVLGELGLLSFEGELLRLTDDEKRLDLLYFLADLVRAEREICGLQLAGAIVCEKSEENLLLDRLITTTSQLHRAAFLRGAASQPASLSQVFGRRTFDALTGSGLLTAKGRLGFATNFAGREPILRFFEVALWGEFVES